MKKILNQLVLNRIILLVTLICFFTHPIQAQQKKINTSKKWAVELSLKSGYDNNALRYSEKYLQRFKNNEDEGRFHIKKYDDIVFDYTARITYSNRFFKNLLSVLSARVDYNQYTFNPIKTWYQFDLMYQQYFTQKTSLMFSYSYLPEFYISHFRDNDWVNLYGYVPSTFQPFTYSKNDFSIWLQHNFSASTKVRVYCSLTNYYYNKHFTEYDSDNYMAGARIFHDVSSKVSVDAGYKFLRSNAKGYDEPGESKLSSDDADATYNEHNILFGLSYQMPKLFRLKNKLNLSFDIYRRYYLTDKTVQEDQLHSGRNDINYRIGVKYDFDLLNNLNVGLYMNYAYRDAEGSNVLNNEFISDEKDYNQTQIGVSVYYKFQF